jgi:hypothetical protein
MAKSTPIADPEAQVVDKGTIDKIKKLFAYRKLTDLLKISGLDQDKEFVASIINVQYQIYRLDAYLESQWELDRKVIKSLWRAIFVSLESMGYKKKQIEKMVGQIGDYEKIERNCRKDEWPTSVSLKKFYLTKSCDVRLIRHLIYKAHPDLKELFKENAWEYFDIITEINDDISDVLEDIHTYNGNRFLIAILRKGADQAVKKYKDYLSALTTQANEYLTPKIQKGKYKQLAGWMNDRSLQTLKLLDHYVQPKNLSRLSESLLLQHMK